MGVQKRDVFPAEYLRHESSARLQHVRSDVQGGQQKLSLEEEERGGGGRGEEEGEGEEEDNDEK